MVMYVEHSLGIQNTFGDTKGGNISVAKTHCTNDLELMQDGCRNLANP